MTLASAPLLADLRAATRAVPDFPAPGVVFQDLCGVYLRPALVRGLANAVAAAVPGGFDRVLAIDARGFLLGMAVAQVAERPLALARKPGKLPGPVHREAYDLEYGNDALEVGCDALPPGCRVLAVDDVLATGGTLAAAVALTERAGARVAGLAVILEIAGLGGRDRLAGFPLQALDLVGKDTHG